jgi:hypothetical protein
MGLLKLVDWESFALHFPSLTTETIEEIKEKPSDNPESLIAQYLIQNESNMSWRHVIIALLEINESGLAYDQLGRLKLNNKGMYAYAIESYSRKLSLVQTE